MNRFALGMLSLLFYVNCFAVEPEYTLDINLEAEYAITEVDLLQADSIGETFAERIDTLDALLQQTQSDLNKKTFYFQLYLSNKYPNDLDTFVPVMAVKNAFLRVTKNDGTVANVGLFDTYFRVNFADVPADSGLTMDAFYEGYNAIDTGLNYWIDTMNYRSNWYSEITSYRKSVPAITDSSSDGGYGGILQLDMPADFNFSNVAQVQLVIEKMLAPAIPSEVLMYESTRYDAIEVQTDSIVGVKLLNPALVQGITEMNRSVSNFYAYPTANPTDLPSSNYVQYFPSSGGVYIAAFEDQYPARGDYDFNDVVVAYRYHIDVTGEISPNILTPDLRIKSFKLEAWLINQGGVYDHDVHFKLPFDEANSCSYLPIQQEGGLWALEQNNYIPHVNIDSPFYNLNDTSGDAVFLSDMGMRVVYPNGCALSIGDSNQQIDVHAFVGSKALFQDIRNCINSKCEEEIPYPYAILRKGTWDETTLEEFLAKGVKPYIVVKKPDGGRVAIHLPGDELSNFRDALGYIEVGNTANNFIDENDFPFGMIFPDSWVLPKELQSIAEVYSDFRTYVESAGANKPDWYKRPNMDKVEQRGANLIRHSVVNTDGNF